MTFRVLFVILGCLTAGPAEAQLALRTEPLPLPAVYLRVPGPVSLSNADLRRAGETDATPRNTYTFDFTRTRPHLAFFCRLEINESAGYVIPAKFRLGGHQHWQDNLLRH